MEKTDKLADKCCSCLPCPQCAPSCPKIDQAHLPAGVGPTKSHPVQNAILVHQGLFDSTQSALDTAIWYCNAAITLFVLLCPTNGIASWARAATICPAGSYHQGNSGNGCAVIGSSLLGVGRVNLRLYTDVRECCLWHITFIHLCRSFCLLSRSIFPPARLRPSKLYTLHQTGK